MNWLLLQNSLIVSAATTTLAAGVGAATALLIVSAPPFVRRCLLTAAVIALALPSFLVTNAWLHWFGQEGPWRAWLPVPLFSPAGTVAILTCLTWPIPCLLALGAWQGIEPAHLESDPAVRSWDLLRWILWPAARSALGLGAALTFVLAFNHFPVPALLQTRVYPAELWIRFNTTFDYAAAVSLGWPLLLLPIPLLLLASRRTIGWPRWQGAVSSALLRRQLGPGAFTLALGLGALTLLGSIVLPATQLLASARTWLELPGAVAAGWPAVRNSLLLAVGGATLGSALGLLGWKSRGMAISWLAFLTPGILLAIAWIYLLNRPATAALHQSALLVLLAVTVRHLALGWQASRHAMQSLDPDLTDAARLDGLTGWRLFRRVHWPQIAPALLAGWYIIYLLCLWEVETLVLLAPPGVETLGLRIFNLLHYGHASQVNALCVVLLGLALLPLAAWQLTHFARTFATSTRFRHGPALLGLTATVAGLGAGCSEPPPAGALTPIESRLFEGVRIIGRRGTAPGQFNKPRSLTVDAQDNLYVADLTGRIQKFSPDGAYLLSWQMPQTDLGKPKGMCRDHDGSIVVLEPHYQRVNHFSTDGRLLRQWGQRGTNDGDFVLPRALAINSRGEYFVSEYTTVDRVQQFQREPHRWLRTFGRSGLAAGELNRPEGLAVDALDQLHVADSCNHRIQVFTRDGRFVRTYGRPGAGPGELSYPYDIQIDPAGYLFVCEFGNSRIQVFRPDGTPFEIIGRPGAAPGEFANPWAVAFDSHGNLYVADAINHRVQKLIRRASTAPAVTSLPTAAAATRRSMP